METIDKAVVTNTQATFSVLPVSDKALDKDTAMKQAKELRAQAEKDHQTYTVGGRNAMMTAMSKLYALFYAVMESNSKSEVLASMKGDLGKKVRTNTRNGAVFIRYVFENLDDKQVSVYATALEVAYSKAKLPADFVEFINNSKGFEGVRADSVESAFKNYMGGEDFARGCVALETINYSTWGVAEEFKVFIAVNKGDGTAELKDIGLTAARVQACLSVVYNEIKERNREQKSKPLTDSEKSIKKDLKAKVSYQIQMIAEHKHNITQADEESNLTAKDAAQQKLALAKILLKAYKTSLKQLGETEQE